MTDSGQWTDHTVAGHPCEVFQPKQVNPHGYVLVYLHGVHQQSLRDKQGFLEQFEHFGLPVVCPRTGPSWWCDRVCAAFDSQLTAETYVREHILPFIQEQWQSRPPQIGLLGTSMGGQGALRFSYKYPNEFPVVAAIAPAVDYHIRMLDPEEDEPLFDMYEDPEQCRQDTALLHIHPLNWPRHQFFCCDPTDIRWADSADRLRMKLSSLGVPFESDLETSGGGHSFRYYEAMAPRAVTFLHDSLERERLRIV